MIKRLGIGLMIVKQHYRKAPSRGGGVICDIEDKDWVDSKTKLQRSPFQGGGGFAYNIEGRDWVDSEYKITEKSLPGGRGGSPIILRVGIGLIVNTKLQRSPFQGGGGFTYNIEGRDWVDSEYKITEKSLPGGRGVHL